MKFLQFSLLILTIVATSHAINLSCLVKSVFWAGSSLKTCMATNVTESDPEVEEDLQEELNTNPEDFPEDTTEEDLEGIYIKDKDMPNFPKRLSRRFKKLKALEFNNCGLDSVTSEEFRGLSSLVYVSFPSNRFKMLPGRLFRHVPGLKWVNFQRNTQLTNIGFKLFMGLSNLINLELGDSGCTGELDLSNLSLAALTARLMGSCPPDEEDFEEDLNNMECEFTDEEEEETTTAGAEMTTTIGEEETTTGGEEDTTTEYQSTSTIIWG